ncbi:hypothetical protein CC78DRAFT_228089 [Lojkania enalia]|uniref:Secreted protein n=1 Tax=Lojkania enalia TaxID=147567 RepID=A0A9P4N498_9PLEO|nr:hypothetical protein CC78DRAFT_228089 [Didymosphaeria enalia]
MKCNRGCHVLLLNISCQTMLAAEVCRPRSRSGAGRMLPEIYRAVVWLDAHVWNTTSHMTSFASHMICGDEVAALTTVSCARLANDKC